MAIQTIPTILSSLASLCVTGWLWILTYQLRKQEKQIQDLHRKLYSADHDIKTLHFNQKMLQSSIKELRRDLKIYGEIKRSKERNIFAEKEGEDNWPKDSGIV